MKRIVAIALAGTLALPLALGLAACTGTASGNGSGGSGTGSPTTVQTQSTEAAAIEHALNLANMGAEWTYSDEADAWTLAPVVAVVNPQIPDEQGVSVCVPAAYVLGVDTTGDGEPNATNGTAVGTLVIDPEAQVTSSNGQVYTAATAPVILNTGAAGFGPTPNAYAPTIYAAEGYINVTCGNRGKQDAVTDRDGAMYFTGDAPSALVDQKNAVRFVTYNIALGNLPGSAERIVTTGGSGGGAHALMLAVTGDSPDFLPYEAACGAVGVYVAEDGSYETQVSIDDQAVSISDRVWGCIAYSPLTSLAEADMALAFESYLDPTYEYASPFQAQTAEYLADEYMRYINAQQLSVNEAQVGFDLDGDGRTRSTVDLTIDYNAASYASTNGYGGAYLDLYLAELEQNLQWYLDNLDYAEGWTWFDEKGKPLSDEAVAAMTLGDKQQAFLLGRYAKGGAEAAAELGLPDEVAEALTEADAAGTEEVEAADATSAGDADAEAADDSADEGAEAVADAEGADAASAGDADATAPDGSAPTTAPDATSAAGAAAPDAAPASTAPDSATYDSFGDMLAAYQTDVASVQAGDEFGNNIVDLYNPLGYIGADSTNAAWVRIVMGAAEGDISLLNSLNLQLAFLRAGVDVDLEWQWDGGHVPGEVLGNSLPLRVDTLFAAYTEDAEAVQKPEPQPQQENGTEAVSTGVNIASWVSTTVAAASPVANAGAAATSTTAAAAAGDAAAATSDAGAAEDAASASADATSEAAASDNSTAAAIAPAPVIDSVAFTLASAAEYRAAKAVKPVPGFDLIDYAQDDYLFGNATADARHWDPYLLEAFNQYTAELAPLFNAK